MSRTLEGIVEAHQAARERRAAGRPIWDHRIDVSDVFGNDDLSFIERRDEICARIRGSVWFKNDDPDDFDEVWDALYDKADVDRVWIGTF